MRDALDSRAEKHTRQNPSPALMAQAWQPPSAPTWPAVPANFGAHFPTNPPWQTRRAGWRLFVQGPTRR
jgi:hypothetical protein